MLLSTPSPSPSLLPGKCELSLYYANNFGFLNYRSLGDGTGRGEDPLRDYFIDSAISLAPRYAESLSRNDLDKCIGYARIYGDVGCSYASYLVYCSAPRCLQFTEVAVEIARHPEREVHLFVFPYFDELAAAINASLPEQRISLAVPFVPLVQRLIGYLITHLILPSDDDGGDATDDDEDVARYRKYNIGQCISAYTVLGTPTGVLEVIIRALTEALPLLEAPAHNWRPAEAALYALRCVALRLNPPTDDVAALLGPFRDGVAVALLGKAGNTSVALRRVTLGAVGAYAKYFRGATCLPQLLEGIANALECNVPVLQGAAASAFADVCDACAKDLCRYAESFKTLYARSLGLTGAPAQDVARGLCAVIGAMPSMEATPMLDAYCAATTTELHRIVAAAAAAVQQGISCGEKERTLVLDTLGRLKVFLSCIKDSVHVIACLGKIFPVAEALVAGAQGLCNPDVVGAMVALYDVALSRPGSAGVEASVVQSMFRAPVTHYAARPSALDLAFVNGILARMKLASDAAMSPAVRAALAEVLATVSAATVKFLSEGGRAAVLEAPDVVEGFFAFMDTFTTKLPSLIVYGSILHDVITLGLAVLSLTQQPGATRAVCIFIGSVFRMAHSAQVLRPAVDACLSRIGHQVVHTILCGVAGAQPRDFVHNASVVVFQFRNYNRDAFFAIMAACLEIQAQAQQVQNCCGKFPVTLDLETKMTFFTKLKKANSSRNVETVLDEFGFTCKSIIAAN